MAVLENKITLSLEDLEEELGSSKLPRFIRDTEDAFLRKTAEVAEYIADQPCIRAIFVSGPTSSGKTTFTDRLVTSLTAMGKTAYRLSLDDYYSIDQLQFDADGRPDYESLGTIDTTLASENITRLLRGETVTMPSFDFHRRVREPEEFLSKARLENGGLLIVEGLHGLSPAISGMIPRELWVGIFIMPWGEIVADRRLIGSQQVRLLRRIVRDTRHRGAHALATIDYWPMITASEINYFPEYLAAADFYVNTMLTYECMVIAPLALAEIKSSLELYGQNTLDPSVFLTYTEPRKPFADIGKALAAASQLVHDLARIPPAPSSIVPPHSILNEFL